MLAVMRLRDILKNVLLPCHLINIFPIFKRFLTLQRSFLLFVSFLCVVVVVSLSWLDNAGIWLLFPRHTPLTVYGSLKQVDVKVTWQWQWLGSSCVPQRPLWTWRSSRHTLPGCSMHSPHCSLPKTFERSHYCASQLNGWGFRITANKSLDRALCLLLKSWSRGNSTGPVSFAQGARDRARALSKVDTVRNIVCASPSTAVWHCRPQLALWTERTLRTSGCTNYPTVKTLRQFSGTLVKIQHFKSWTLIISAHRCLQDGND